MTAQEVLDKAIESGVFLYVRDEQLKYRARTGTLSPELKSELTRHRDSIVEHLRRIGTTPEHGGSFDPPPLHQRAGGGIVPLSYAQQRLWVIDRLGGSAQYHAQSAHRLTGRLNVEALRRALSTIIERHESLRTVIAEENGTPYQVVLPGFELELPQTDLSGLPDAQQEIEIQRLIAKDLQQPFDLGRDLMFRGHLLTLGPDRYVVLFGLHHIAADAWSLGILQTELITLYPAHCEGRGHPLAPLKLQYADYTMWQRAFLRGEPLARELAFWKGELKGIPEVHRLPLDRERPVSPTHAGGAVRCKVEPQTLDDIRALCKRYDVTLFMFLETAVSILLSRYSDETDIVMGTPVGGRLNPDLESLIGLFVNTVVLRARLDGNPTFLELLARNRQSVLDALAHQHVPFDMVVDEMKPRRTTSYSPLFQILFNMQPAGPRRFTLPGLTFEAVSGGSRSSKFDLVFNIVESAGELSVNFGYSAEIFLAATIERMVANFRVLLASILAAPEQRAGDLELLAPAERNRQLRTLNQGREAPVYILDAGNRLMPEGAVGELCVREAAFTPDSKDVRTFIPDRFTPGGGTLVRTGELARWSPAGELQRVGRVGDRVANLPLSVDADAPRAEFEGPTTETEGRMARLWNALLPDQPIGIRENFFGAGGHSLSMIVLIKRISKEFSVDIPLATFMESPTIQDTARFVDGANESQDAAFDEVLRNVASRSRGIPPLSDEQRASPLPLSFAQTRIWFITRLEEGRSSYNIPAPLRFTGPVCRESLRRSFETIVARHAILRTVYREESDQPVQRILAPAVFELPLLDLSALPPDAQARSAGEVIRAESVRPFDLTVEPSLRVLLLKLSEENHILLFNVHHIAADGWSIGVLTRELNAIYGAYRQGRAHSLPELPIQYCDYAVWQREWLAGPVLEEHLEFWKTRLSGIPKVHSLPLDRPRPSYQSYRGAHHSMKIDGAVVRGLEELSRSHNATLFMVLQAALAVLLHRYSGESDIVIGAPVANRLQTEVEPLIGCFVNSLVLRSDLSNNPRFADFLAATNENLLQVYAHQSIPFEVLVEELNPERDLSHAPLFQVMFAFQNNEGEAIALPDLKFTRAESDYPISKFDLTLYARQTAGRLSLTWEYATDIFNQATIESLASSLGVLLEGIVRTPEERVGALRLLTPEIEQQLLRQARGIAADTGAGLCIHEVVEARAREWPEAIAVRTGGATLTYGELNRTANQLARALRNRGVRTGTLVGICVERSLETIVGMLGILKAGGAYLPLDAAYPAERLRYLLSDSGVEVVLASGVTRDLLPVGEQSLILLDELLDGRSQELRHEADQDLSSAELAIGPESLAYVIYTSGSTGQPKGVAVEHRGVTRLVCQPDYVALGPETVTLQHSAMTFDASTFEIWAPLLNGGTVAMLQSDSGDVASMAREVQEYGVNTLWLTAGLLPLWVEQHTPALGIRNLLSGGDVLPPRFVDEIYSRDPAVTVINGYGPTENTTFSCCYRVPRGPREAATVPIGTPIRGSSAYVLDPFMQLQPVGCPGELYVGGAGVARGYVGQPELTRERFVPNPFSSAPGEERLYNTRDIARWLSDGTLEFLGRNDQQVKIRGFRVEPGEVENHLSRVPGVSDCVVISSDARGTGRQLVAYIVAAPGAAEDDADDDADNIKERCRRRLRESLPEYMVPATYVVIDRMPLTASLKIDRRALPAPSESDLPKTAFVPPRTATERTVAEIWQELLRLSRVGIDDNFFELGGHSLLAARFISKVRGVFAVEIPIRVVFEKPTIRELATWFDIYNAVAIEAMVSTDGEEMFL